MRAYECDRCGVLFKPAPWEKAQSRGYFTHTIPNWCPPDSIGVEGHLCEDCGRIFIAFLRGEAVNVPITKKRENELIAANS